MLTGEGSGNGGRMTGSVCGCGGGAGKGGWELLRWADVVRVSQGVEVLRGRHIKSGPSSAGHSIVR